MCKDNQYGCHATAAGGGLVWTGVVTNLAVTPATEAPVTRKPSTKEGIEAWGIKFLSVRINTSQQEYNELTLSFRFLLDQPPRRFLPPAKTRATQRTKAPRAQTVLRVEAVYPEAPLQALSLAALLALRSLRLALSSCIVARNLPTLRNTTPRLPENIPTSLRLIPPTSQAKWALHLPLIPR